MARTTTALLLSASLLCLTVGGCHPNANPDGTGTGEPGASCEGRKDCRPGTTCWSEVCVQYGDLRFSLVWTTDTDLDLHVLTPDRVELYYSNPVGGGGQLDVDDCISGACSNPGATHVENIFFDDTAARGTYEYWVDNYDEVETADWELDVIGGPWDHQKGTVSAEVPQSEHFTVEY